MQEQFERLSQIEPDVYFPGSVAPNPLALEIARHLAEEFAHLPPCGMTSEPEDGAISFEWGFYGVFVTVEPNGNIDYNHFHGNDLSQETDKYFSYPNDLDKLREELEKVLPKQGSTIKLT